MQYDQIVNQKVTTFKTLVIGIIRLKILTRCRQKDSLRAKVGDKKWMKY